VYPTPLWQPTEGKRPSMLDVNVEELARQVRFVVMIVVIVIVVDNVRVFMCVM